MMQFSFIINAEVGGQESYLLGGFMREANSVSFINFS